MANTTSIPLQPLISQVTDNDLLAIWDVNDTPPGYSYGVQKRCSAAQLNQYVQLSLSGSNRTSCKAACTAPLVAAYLNGQSGIGATLTNTGAFAAFEADGVTLSIGDRVLVQFQAQQLQNGIYTVTNTGSPTSPWVLTRATDYDGGNSFEIQQGNIIGVTLGGLYGLTIWFQTAAGPFVVGLSPIVFEPSNSEVQFWQNITSAAVPIQMEPDNGYVINALSQVTLILPPGIAFGQEIKIQGVSSTFYIAQNAGQKIIGGETQSTAGIAGHAVSTLNSAGISLLYVGGGIFTTNGSAPQASIDLF